MKTRFFRSALAAVLVTSTAAPLSAQVLTTYSNGDIFLGFRRAGTANTLAVNIGSARQFLTTAQGGTNDSTAPFNVRFGVVPGTSTAVASIGPDLNAVFTSNWTNNPTDGTGVRWGVVGISGNTSSGIPGYTARTLFVTRARTAPGTPTSIPADRLDIGDYETFSSAFNSFVQGTGGSAFKNQSSTVNSSAAYVGAASGPDNWGARVDEASEGSFGLGSGYEVEQTFGPFSGSTDSVLDLWISPNDGLTAIPVNQNTYLGFFTLGTGGELTFTPAGSATAPTITGFTPGSGSVGTPVNIVGTGFTGTTNVSFGGTGTTNFSITGGTNIAATVPPGAATGPIVVDTASGSATSSSNFTVTPSVPNITGFTPSSGGAGSSVSINGTGLNGATGVTFNGVGAVITANTATQITATVPPAATTGTIAVVTAGGTATSSSNFTVLSPVNSTNISGTGLLLPTATFAAIISGNSSTNGGTNSAIIGAANSVIPSGTRFAFIGAGNFNNMAAGSHSAAMIAGFSNTIAGGGARAATLGGGFNTVAGRSAGIFGGEFNQIGVNSTGAAIIGGLNNLVAPNASGAFVGGGNFNEVRAVGGAVVGGFANEAAGANSFAAGSQAVASNSGTFVWADSSTASDFVSTAANQFLVRAQNGVGINTNNPGANALSVNGTVQITSIQVLTGTGNPTIAAPNGSLYLRTDGAAQNSLWIRAGGVWHPVLTGGI